MADPLLYSWVRRGLASLISGQVTTNSASLPVSLGVNGAAMPAPAVQLIGPGDITGLDPRSVVRTEPRDRTDAFESNYLAAVEFALPDLPWLFTPSATPTGERLTMPWLCLVVVPDAPGFTLETNSGGVSLLKMAEVKGELPDLATIDLFVHAQLPQGLTFDDPSALSRILSPRRLDINTGYIACVVPTFRAGMNAALGLPVDDHDVAPAWAANATGPLTLPVYYSFRFRTGPGGDFASLASKIGPPPADPKLDAGTRPMDVSQPGPFFPAPVTPKLTAGLEGALRTFGNQPLPLPAADDAKYRDGLTQSLTAGTQADPIVTPRTYGRAQTALDLKSKTPAPPVWMQELNLDARNRAAAGAGAQIVQRDQEALVASAWDQVGEIRKANQLVRQAQLARQVLLSIGKRHLDTVPADGAYLQMTAPMHSRVRLTAGVNLSLKGQIDASLLPAGAVSPALRRMTRPRGPIGRQLTAAPRIVERLNLPATAPNLLRVAGPAPQPAGMNVMDQAHRIQTGALTASGGFKVAAVLKTQVDELKTQLEVKTPAEPPKPATDSGKVPAGTLDTEKDATKTQVDHAPVSITRGGFLDDPDIPEILKGTKAGLPDAFTFPVEAAALAQVNQQFRAAATAVNVVLNATPPAAPPPPAPLATTARAQLRARLDPELTIRARVGARLTQSGTTVADPLTPIRTGPVYPQPMYAALAQLSAEWLLPGVSRVPTDCAALLLTNAAFIEAFLLGLNEEMSHELLWREYPLGTKATYFQNFWATTPPAPDIPAVNTFSANGHLGDHTADHAAGDRVVFLVRSKLFQRYPNALVSAVHATWTGSVRVLGTETKFPIFRGEIGADIVFFGFDIADPQGAATPPGDAGWFFVIQEHLTEPRFGLEPQNSTEPQTDWPSFRFNDSLMNGNFLNPLAHVTPPAGADAARWGASAAAMADILTRTPVQVAIHARALLGEN
ncbi:MAG TPA: hypothetical protein VN736_18690 [Candidatus Limnocylindrales bacterium]|nr:hypothetical protein [Candidatus Limnocylindrales bacterium]